MSEIGCEGRQASKSPALPKEAGLSSADERVFIRPFR
jgi:hypothetical protein